MMVISDTTMWWGGSKWKEEYIILGLVEDGREGLFMEDFVTV